MFNATSSMQKARPPVEVGLRNTSQGKGDEVFSCLVRAESKTEQCDLILNRQSRFSGQVSFGRDIYF
jgi:hypothetical protein